MNHTPGPWYVARDVYGVLRVWGVAVGTDEDGETHRCEVDVATCCGDGSLTAEEEQANAEFIATAPAIEAERDKLQLALNNAHLEVEAFKGRNKELSEMLDMVLRSEQIGDALANDICRVLAGLPIEVETKE